ncbi:MAG: squalene/phytoene synthase family protein [Planctomycetaceae bacterium]|nr:squalene/phytoene synthase family protein [Planctomycetaceae bacterium]
MQLSSSETNLGGDGWLGNMAMDVSREITKRIADGWFHKLKWSLSAWNDSQQVAIRDMRAFLLVARDEIFALNDLDQRRVKHEQWTYSLNQALMGKSHSDAAAAIAETANRFEVPRSFFHEALTAIESNLFRERLVNNNDLLRLAYRQTGTFMLSAAKIADLYEPLHRDYFLCLGIGVGVLDVIMDWQHWEKTNWLPIPLDWVKEVSGAEAALRQGDWRKPLKISSRVRRTLLPSLVRRMATLGIETLTQAKPTSAVQDSRWYADFAQWTEQSLDQLHDVFSSPEKLLG